MCGEELIHIASFLIFGGWIGMAGGAIVGVSTERGGRVAVQECGAQAEADGVRALGGTAVVNL